MYPFKFPEHNIIFAENQKEYLPLPAYLGINEPTGTVITCWKLSLSELIKVIFTRNIYLSVMTFSKPLQPLKMGTSFKEVK